MMQDDSNWLRVEGGEEQLECPPSLEPQLQELLSGEEMFLVGAGVEDVLSQTLMPNIPKPSPMEYAEWILWCTPQADMLDWW